MSDTVCAWCKTVGVCPFALRDERDSAYLDTCWDCYKGLRALGDRLRMESEAPLMAWASPPAPADSTRQDRKGEP